ncbi:NADH:flavin oxidoreductase/NADH oxidase [Bifidobacterium vespertilionis]|uniref:NADH:flavin oxidoreductase/NADH oxidase n=1 Tax=Bifidobacterium vespertilionis TaxID=2562524 RepID=UPI001F0B5439|nr:NADH:flavin oxidoreductase/NADH oxidase [Bifidobacterium vespertilionis]
MAQPEYDDMDMTGFDMRGFTVADKTSAYDRDDDEDDPIIPNVLTGQGATSAAQASDGASVDGASAAGADDDTAGAESVASAAPSPKKPSRKGLFKSSKNATKAEAPALFSPIALRGATARNRIWLPPMDTYSAFARDGKPTPFHYQHYVSRAMGGFGLVCFEATAVTPDGRISPCDLGLWDDDQIEAYRWIVQGVKDAGAVAAIQLNHAGRKGSTGCFATGFEGESVPQDQGGWPTVAPSPIAFDNFAAPRELTVDEIHGIVGAFRAAAVRAVNAGFDVIEIHAAHGYLLSEFLDPLTNTRTDEYGGSLENRMRMLVEVVDAVRAAVAPSVALFVRVSATDWAAGGWDLNQTIETARVLKVHGVDLVDVSTGGILPGVAIPAKPNYQVPFSEQIRLKALVPTTAVGLITKPKQADRIVRRGEADAVQIGRAALRDPYWPLRAADKLGLKTSEAPYQPQYIRGAY